VKENEGMLDFGVGLKVGFDGEVTTAFLKMRW
jgi:hypothetical protein